jgi:hypothetical protein
MRMSVEEILKTNLTTVVDRDPVCGKIRYPHTFDNANPLEQPRPSGALVGRKCREYRLVVR